MVYRATDPGSRGELIGQTTTDTFVDRDIVPGTRYFYTMLPLIPVTGEEFLPAQVDEVADFTATPREAVVSQWSDWLGLFTDFITSALGIAALTASGLVVAGGGALASGVSSVVSSGASSQNLVTFFFFWLRPNRKRKYWGRVKSAEGELPLMGAEAGLIPHELRGTLQHTVTDPAGGYRFSLNKAGVYSQAVTASGYYSYAGEEHSFAQSGPKKEEVLLLQKDSQSDLILPALTLSSRWYQLIQLVTFLMTLIFLLGFSLTVRAVILQPNLLHILAIGWYLLLIFLWLREYLKPTISGAVLAASGQPLAKVVVRAYQMRPEGKALIATTVTNRSGEYQFHLPAHFSYVLTSELPRYSPFTTLPLSLARGASQLCTLVMEEERYHSL